jgi:Calcium binding
VSGSRRGYVAGTGSVAKKLKPDAEREERIEMEIVVDAYDEEERAMGWYYYLEDQLKFPFTAICTTKRAVSPVRVKDEVEVISMAAEAECDHEMFVTIRWGTDSLAVPLAQLTPVAKTDEATRQAVEDWHYWIRMGYEF